MGRLRAFEVRFAASRVGPQSARSLGRAAGEVPWPSARSDCRRSQACRHLAQDVDRRHRISLVRRVGTGLSSSPLVGIADKCISSVDDGLDEAANVCCAN